MITPRKPPKARNLHLENARQTTPLRKSALNNSLSLNHSPITLNNESDESERNKRRTLVDIQRRMSTTPASPAIQVGDQEIKTHFQICLKMFAENKISSKNAWNLKIIDYMRQMLQTNRMNKDSLQLGSASLDVSTKVYGIRVDDIHSDGLKLASSMARIAHKTPSVSNDVESVDGSELVESENTAPKRKKKPRRLSATSKHTIAKDPSSLLADIPKLESAFFQTRSNADASTTDNYFTNRLLKDPSGCKFMLLGNKRRVWDDDDDPTLEGDEKYPFNIEKLIKLDICPDFRNFEVDVWDPDNDEVAENTTLHNNSELVFDDKGIPMAELDGSIHDVFDAPDPLASDVDEDDAPIVITKELAKISEMKPTSDNCTTTEYLYQSLLKLSNNSMQMWAGPSHWKLKHLQRAVSKFSGAVADIKPKSAPRKNKKDPNGPINYRREEMEEVEEELELPPSKKGSISHSSDKYFLPAKVVVPNNLYQKLLIKHIYPEYKNENSVDNHSSEKDEYEIEPYNYENANDSLYCSQNNMDDDGGHHTHEEEDIVMNAQDPQYMGENLIEQANVVPKIKMGYATQAKKMDMKKLKAAIWKCLTNEYGEVTEGAPKKKVQKISFAEVYSKLPSLLNKKMAEELSCSLAFIAILHLANENNLMLTGEDDLSNFFIEQGVTPC